MSIIWSKKIDEILSVGCSLENEGINNWVLCKDDALLSLDKLLNIKVAVLGGDVYENIDGVLQSNYDNWYCDKIEEESKQEYLIRSVKAARAYIENYKHRNGDEIYFAIVPDV